MHRFILIRIRAVELRSYLHEFLLWPKRTSFKNFDHSSAANANFIGLVPTKRAGFPPQVNLQDCDLKVEFQQSASPSCCLKSYYQGAAWTCAYAVQIPHANRERGNDGQFKVTWPCTGKGCGPTESTRSTEKTAGPAVCKIKEHLHLKTLTFRRDLAERAAEIATDGRYMTSESYAVTSRARAASKVVTLPRQQLSF